MRKIILALSLMFAMISTPVFAEVNLSASEQQDLLKTVIEYLNHIADKDNQIVIKEAADERRFKLKGLWDVIEESSNGSEVIYKVQADSDEVELKKTDDGSILLRYTILNVDVKRTPHSWEIIQLSIGSRHLRQTELGHSFEEGYYYIFSKVKSDRGLGLAHFRNQK